jgi:hypothetical protein
MPRLAREPPAGTTAAVVTRERQVARMVVRILPSDSSTPVGKIADAEVLFDEGVFDGLKLVGFSIWEPRAGGSGRRNVTFPARSFSVNGERRSFALLRPVVDSTAQEPLRALILQAFAEYEAQQASGEPAPTAAPAAGAHADATQTADTTQTV